MARHADGYAGPGPGSTGHRRLQLLPALGTGAIGGEWWLNLVWLLALRPRHELLAMPMYALGGARRGSSRFQTRPDSKTHRGVPVKLRARRRVCLRRLRVGIQGPQVSRLRGPRVSHRVRRRQAFVAREIDYHELALGPDDGSIFHWRMRTQLWQLCLVIRSNLRAKASECIRLRLPRLATASTCARRSGGGCGHVRRAAVSPRLTCTCCSGALRAFTVPGRRGWAGCGHMRLGEALELGRGSSVLAGQLDCRVGPGARVSPPHALQVAPHLLIGEHVL